jgi:tetratricopeptide (TPR) repeat protein
VDKKIAVAGFSYSDGRDSHDGGVVAERITTELVKAKKFKVIERKEIEKVFEELKLQRSGAIDPNSAKEIGKMLGADWLVVGTLTELPDKHLELNTRLVSVDSGEILTATSGRLKKDWLNEYRKILIVQNTEIVKRPKNARAFYERGKTYADLWEDDNAIASFGIAIGIDPTYLEAYLGRGFGYIAKGEYDRAIEDSSKAIVINPKSSRAFLNRGSAFTGKGEYDKAIEDLTKALELGPKTSWAYDNRGLAYEKKGDLEKALTDYNKAIEINSSDAVAYAGRGWVYVYPSIKRYGDAITDLTKAIEIIPMWAPAYKNRGIVYYLNGRNSDALNDFNTAVRLKPGLKVEIQPLIDKITKPAPATEPSSQENGLVGQRSWWHKH